MINSNTQSIVEDEIADLEKSLNPKHKDDEEFILEEQAVQPKKRNINTNNLLDLTSFTDSNAALDEKVYNEGKVIDQLLASVPKNEGYYLKLYRISSTNEPEFKLKLNNWQNWSDLEYEINQIVRDYTAKNPGKWGSGRYRIVVWKESGTREYRKPMDFLIDAMETNINDTSAINVSNINNNPEEQLNSLSKLLSVVNQINPPTNQAEQQKIINEAFMQGMNLAKGKETENQSAMAVMMTGMMTMMTKVMETVMVKPNIPNSDANDQFVKTLQILGSLGIIGKTEQKQATAFDFINELKAAGLWKEPISEDPIKKITELKDLMSIVTDLGGGNGPRPSIGEKLIEILAPKIPDVIGNITSTVNNMVDFKKQQIGMKVNKEQIKNVQPALNATQDTNIKGNNEMSKISDLFEELYTAIKINDTSKFPYIAHNLEQFFGSDSVLREIASGKLPEKDLISMLEMYGGTKYKEPVFKPLLTNYIKAFTQFLFNHFSTTNIPQTAVVKNEPITNELTEHLNKPFITTCNLCHCQVDFDSEQDYLNEDKECGRLFDNGTTCKGLLIKTESPESANLELEQQVNQ